MYAVIKTGGKQYRVQPGDVLIVEKLDGDAGSEVNFDQVLAMGEGADVMLGAPLIEGAFVKATLIETRKGEKVKVFKKIRRQGYRRTKGHRQPESVLRVTSIGGKGAKTEKWDGEVDLTTRAVINARARGFKDAVEAPAAEAKPAQSTAKAAKPAAPKAAKAPKAAETKGALVEQPISEVEAGAPETVAAEPKPAQKAEATKKAAAPKKAEAKAEAAPKKAAAPKAKAETKTKTDEAPKAKAAPKAAKAKAETKSEAAPAKKPAAKKAKPADGGKA